MHLRETSAHGRRTDGKWALEIHTTPPTHHLCLFATHDTIPRTFGDLHWLVVVRASWLDRCTLKLKFENTLSSHTHNWNYQPHSFVLVRFDLLIMPTATLRPSSYQLQTGLPDPIFLPATLCHGPTLQHVVPPGNIWIYNNEWVKKRKSNLNGVKNGNKSYHVPSGPLIGRSTFEHSLARI